MILASIILAVPLPIHDLWIVAVHRTCTCVRFATASTRGELTGLTPLAPSPRTAGPEIALPLFRDTALLAFHSHGSPRLARILWTVPDVRPSVRLSVSYGHMSTTSSLKTFILNPLLVCFRTNARLHITLARGRDVRFDLFVLGLIVFVSRCPALCWTWSGGNCCPVDVQK